MMRRMIIVVHSSKMMRPVPEIATSGLSTPYLLNRATELQASLRFLTIQEIQTTMHISEALAKTTYELTSSWTKSPQCQRAAVDSFIGDIYSGLQVGAWTDEDRQYAHRQMRILSGLYGILRPLDGIYPYRFEMGYKIPHTSYGNAYIFWGDSIARTIPSDEVIVNLAAVEYGKVLTKYIDLERIITPRFLTISSKTSEPTFIVVHAKIARGAFAVWMVRRRIDSPAQLKEFSELGYEYSEQRSTPEEPVFICVQFKGLGLSVRLT